MIYVFDVETYAHDWLVVFKNISTGEYTVIHNNNYAVKEFMTADKLLVGFNNKHYDNHIIKAILCGADNTLVKEINDFIIGGGLGWEHWFLQQNRAWFNTFDIRDDMQQGLGLKDIEGHLGMKIEESSVPFDIDRPLTAKEVQETIGYCKYDVDVAERLVKLRKNYLKCKQMLGAMRDISPERSLYMTNAKITAAYLGAKKKEWDDGRVYEYPPNLDRSVIPKEILDFFWTINDLSIPDDKIFKTSLTVDIGGCPTKYAWGGVHGSLSTYREKATGNRIIQNRDVTSLYPSLIIKYDYLSRNVDSPEFFEQTYDRRLQAKHDDNKEVSNTLKLPLNIVSGATEQVYNDLYDPKQARSMRISGQLFMTDLVMRLVDVPSFKLLNFNTDGIMYSVDRIHLPKIDTICGEWESRTRFELETEDIDRVWIKDVNNLLFVKTNGEIKTVGGYLNYGISEKGPWNINNNYTIVKKAIIEYFVNGTPVETFITNCGDILEFQYIAKASSKYSRAYHVVDGKEVEIQRVNRVYASKDTRNGTLYKVHKETGTAYKISGLPDSCIIDNRNELTIEDIDKEHYIQKAKEMIGDFIGDGGEESMEYVRLSDLKKVPGIGAKTMERIRAECEIFTLDEEPEKNEELSSWLDELLESEEI